MYKLNPQNHYTTPDKLYVVQIVDEFNKVNNRPQISDLESCVQKHITIEDQEYSIMTVMYDVVTEKYFALCRKTETR